MKLMRSGCLTAIFLLSFLAIIQSAEPKIDVVILGKNVTLELVLIPAGKFTMGSSEDEKGRSNNETLHDVTLSKSFFLGKYEVTQEQWEAVMGTNPSAIKGAKLPVTDVTWNDCQEFIKKLNDKTKGGYRLPTEAEWEYAARAGTKTAYSFGDTITSKDANYSDSKIGKPSAVGSYKPNAFGLYDMHGNVFEWCQDWRAVYPVVAVTDPVGPNSGMIRVVRGGSFSFDARDARSADRDLRVTPDEQSDYTGFRLAK